jgi:hypothetical protein
LNIFGFKLKQNILKMFLVSGMVPTLTVGAKDPTDVLRRCCIAPSTKTKTASRNSSSGEKASVFWIECGVIKSCNNKKLGSVLWIKCGVMKSFTCDANALVKRYAIIWGKRDRGTY